MTVVVLDASVLVALVSDDGAAGSWAQERIQGKDLAAPHLAPFEATDALRRLQLPGGPLSVDDGTRAVQDLRDLPLQLWPWSVLADRIWELRGSVTSYDAAYVSVAEQLDAALLTLDGRLARASGPRCAILHP